MKFRRLATTFSETLERKLRLLTVHVGFFNRGETRAYLKCEGKKASESNKLTIDVTRISIQSLTKLAGPSQMTCTEPKEYDDAPLHW